MRTHKSHSERPLHYVLESGFLRESRSKTPLFSHFKTPFKSLIWNSFVFTRAKIRLSNQERAESRSETSLGMWFVLMWTGPMSPISWNSLFFVRCTSVLETHYGAVTSLSFAPDGQTLLSSGRDSVVVIWDLDKGQAKNTIPVFEVNLVCVISSWTSIRC